MQVGIRLLPIRAEPIVNPQPNEVNGIRHRMVQIRRKHHEDVRDLIAGAEAVAGWGRHIARYSGAVVGATAVAALWLAARPRRRVPTPTLPSAASETPTAVIEGLVGETKRSKSRASWLGAPGASCFPWLFAQPRITPHIKSNNGSSSNERAWRRSSHLSRRLVGQSRRMVAMMDPSGTRESP